MFEFKFQNDFIALQACVAMMTYNENLIFNDKMNSQ